MERFPAFSLPGHREKGGKEVTHMVTTRIIPLHAGKGRTESRASATSSTMWQNRKRQKAANSSPAVAGKDDVIVYCIDI